MKPQKKNIHYQNKMHIQTKSLNFESTKMIPKATENYLRSHTIRKEHTQKIKISIIMNTLQNDIP